MPRIAFFPSISGLSWFGVLITSSLPPLSITHAQPLPKRVVPAWLTAVLNFSKSPNALLMRVGDRAGRRAAGVRAHQLPEERVVPVAAAVVADRRLDVVRDAVDVLDQVVQALLMQLGVLVERGIEVGDVRLMMLAVMDLHRLAVDMRFERGGVVRQRRK